MLLSRVENPFRDTVPSGALIASGFLALTAAFGGCGGGQAGAVGFDGELTSIQVSGGQGRMECVGEHTGESEEGTNLGDFVAYHTAFIANDGQRFDADIGPVIEVVAAMNGINGYEMLPPGMSLSTFEYCQLAADASR